MDYSTTSDLNLILEDMDDQVPDQILDEILYPSIKPDDTSVVCVNLRGTKFMILSKYFKHYPSSLLSRRYHALVKKTRKRSSEPLEMYFDHNPILFHHIWDAYVNADSDGAIGNPISKMHVPQSFCTRYVEQELAFWGLGESVLHPCCWDRLMEGQENAGTLTEVVKEWEKEDTLRNKHDHVTVRERMHLFLEEPRSSKWAMVRYNLMLTS